MGDKIHSLKLVLQSLSEVNFMLQMSDLEQFKYFQICKITWTVFLWHAEGRATQERGVLY